ncbi:MAG: serine/threonine protein kinase [Armatimonadetes bacterium]|nr:serine/threonine protein kinase [Armatimonadota bacterium]
MTASRGTPFLLLILFLALPALAQQDFVTVTVETTPSGAVISQQGSRGLGSRVRLGVSGQPVQVDRSLLSSSDGKVQLIATLPGYCEEWMRIAPEMVTPGKRMKLPLKPEHEKVIFHTKPPGATVLLVVSSEKENPIGISGEPIQLERKQFRHEGQDTPISVKFVLEGYATAREAQVGPSLWTGKRWPPEGEIQLEPASGPWNLVLRWKLWVAQNPALSAGIGLVALAGILVPALVWIPRRSAQKQQLERARRLDELKVSAETEDPNLLARIGPYRIVDKLGAGGMATVYKGLPDDTLDEEKAVAIKIMSAELAEDVEYRKRFNREIQVSGELDHKNIVRLIDWGEQESVLYLVMELVDGKTLREQVKEGGLPLEEVLKTMEGIIDGLVHAHSKGIVHRDLKPANVMVTRKGVVKIMDLGLARGTSEAHKVTATGDALGTPAYMPPEQISGGSLTHRSDQYALGCMFYEMLAGRLPFEETDPMTLILKHLQETPAPLREWRPDIPASLEKIVSRMLAKEPRERFADMAALRAELQKVQEELQSGGSDGDSQGGDGAVRPPDLTTVQLEPHK